MNNNNNNTIYKYLLGNDKTENEDKNSVVTKREKNSLRLRLSRVFSASGLRSPSSSSSNTNNTNFSWQQLSNNDDQDNNDLLNVLILSQTPQPIIRKERRMKYSPKQFQKERKSESEYANETTTTIPVTTRSGSCLNQNENGPARINDDNSRMISGMFAWIRVFRMATMLHQMAS